MTERTILWFRKGLRLGDSPALVEALKGNPKHLLPVFVLDPWFANPARVCGNRYNFLLESLKDLDTSLRSRGSRLIVLRGKAPDALTEAAKKWKATRICFESDISPYARKRDSQLRASATGAGIDVSEVGGHTLFAPDHLSARAQQNGKAVLPATYEAFRALVRQMPPPPRPVAAPAALPAMLPEQEGGPPDNAALGVPTSVADCSGGYSQEDVTTRYVGEGGETKARARLASVMSQERRPWLETFSKPDTSPTALEPSTTLLSPHLKFGTLGVREFWWELEDALAAARKAGRKPSEPPVSLQGQLLWREFFYSQAATIGSYDKMVGNKACRQFDWDHSADLLDAWEHSRTGYQFIDAAMTQLRTDGWMHHLARHSVACFLTRGDLYQSWEQGARVFDKYLLDADWAINNGNWMWLSASAYFHQYYRVYSPVAFPKKTDPNGDYIRKFLPQFKDFPKEYIYEPWKAPLAVQQRCGVVVGTTYPRRVVEHETASKANIARHKQAFEDARGAGAAGGGGGHRDAESKKRAHSSSSSSSSSKVAGHGKAKIVKQEGGGVAGGLSDAHVKEEKEEKEAAAKRPRP
jgi:cryptochrome